MTLCKQILHLSAIEFFIFTPSYFLVIIEKDAENTGKFTCAKPCGQCV